MAVGKLRVLLAEDDSIGARFAVAALERLGHVVVVVETGRAALDVLKRETFDVAILDMGLPELAGIDVARRFRSHERAQGERSLVIVALTASDLDDEARDAAGIDAVLQKPVEEALLEETLGRCSRPRTPGRAPEEPVALLDLSSLSARAGHDEEFIRELLADFLGLAGTTAAEIADASAGARHGEVVSKAHRLRGALLAVGANRAGRAAGEVEMLSAGLAAATAAATTTEPQRAAVAQALRACFASLDEARAEIARVLADPSPVSTLLLRAAS